MLQALSLITLMPDSTALSDAVTVSHNFVFGVICMLASRDKYYHVAPGWSVQTSQPHVAINL